MCGPDPDQALVGFSADLEWLRSHGGRITRYNLATEPMAFATNDTVRRFLEVAGSQELPLVLVDGITTLTGRYPTREQLSRWAGIDEPAPASSPTGVSLLGLADDQCDGPGCC